MTEYATGRPRRGTALRRRSRYSCAEIATTLGGRRDRLVDQVPVELAAARGLAFDECELAVDEAIDYLVTEYDVPICSDEELERAFWWATSLRVKRLRSGRNATVRGNWTRVNIDLTVVAAHDADPEDAAIRETEQAALREFAATLTDRERLVLGCKYGGMKEKGRRVLARELRLSIGEVRSAEASIRRKLERFSAIMAAGTLCAHREGLFGALGSDRLSEAAERLALIHLESCPACKLGYAARVRALRSGQLERELAGLLPVPPAVETMRSPRAMWDTLCEWAGRPLIGDAAVGSSQVGLATRGLGSIAAAKLVALCIGGMTIVGGGVYCLHGPLAPARDDQVKVERPRAERPKPTATSTPVDTGDPLWTAARSTPTPEPTPTPKPKPRRTPQPQNPVSETSHERENAISPAPADAAPSGASEFGPVGTQSATKPAPPVKSGGPEFP